MFYWSLMMNKLAIAIAIGAAALMGGSAASAAEKATTKSSAGINQPLTDFSSQHRHFHRHHHGHRHHWRHHHRPYYRSYNYYAPRHHGYYGGPRYYGGGPGVTFSFGSGGYRGW
jgi:hypothetical protein